MVQGKRVGPIGTPSAGSDVEQIGPGESPNINNLAFVVCRNSFARSLLCFLHIFCCSSIPSSLLSSNVHCLQSKIKNFKVGPKKCILRYEINCSAGANASRIPPEPDGSTAWIVPTEARWMWQNVIGTRNHRRNTLADQQIAHDGRRADGEWSVGRGAG